MLDVGEPLIDNHFCYFMKEFHSPFLSLPSSQWIASNELAFAVFDGFPVSHGHTLIITKRVIPTWFDASLEEQAAINSLIREVRQILDERLEPKPDGYNVGFNAGNAAGQTVPHVHIHVIPRYHGDVQDPRGGVRYVIPEKANYLKGSEPTQSLPARSPQFQLSTGHPQQPLWGRIAPRLPSATEIDILASFVQLSGLELIRGTLFSALRTGARVRILVGDYLYISDPMALRRLHGWMQVAEEQFGPGYLDSRLVEIQRISSKPASFHPKAWRILDESGGMVVVGSSNLSRPALLTGVEWNIVSEFHPGDAIEGELASAFLNLWESATPLTLETVERYAVAAKQVGTVKIQIEDMEVIEPLPEPRRWQQGALVKLAEIRQDGYTRALAAVATGLGKTWLAAFDVAAIGRQLGRRPRVLIVAHRAEILVQAESTLRRALENQWPETSVSWYLASDNSLDGDLVVASVQKLSRKTGLEQLSDQCFDYAIFDEVHHAHAPSYRKVLARIRASFVLGLTATPERTDGVDVASLFDDILAWQATIGDGIEEGALVPFHYIGLKDDVDFTQIPWKNGRFDPVVLEERVENSARMKRLWKAWQEHPAGRTIVFCCSRRHALFTRNWLRKQGVKAAAVFSGLGSDPRGASLDQLKRGELDAICVVDLFNEGLDLPEIDRVIMLRPTESKVIFIQQLGRGLRASESKTRLIVIDFVGNHRVFGSRIIHLLSLQGDNVGWSGLRSWLGGATSVLPKDCFLTVELKALDLLRRLLPQGATAAVDGYRALRDELGWRPSMTELFNRGFLPGTIRGDHGDWFSFIRNEGDLRTDEGAVLEKALSWFQMLEITALNKCYKMVVLRVLLDRDTLWTGMRVIDLAAACRNFILSHPQLKADLPSTAEIPDHESAPLEVWAAWWLKWPLGRWLDLQKGRRWFQIEEDHFKAVIPGIHPGDEAFENMTSEIVDYRLAQYARTRLAQTDVAEGQQFTAKVSHSNQNPILFLPEKEKCPGRPTGPIDVLLPDGSRWVFRFVKVACNVAHEKGGSGNSLGDLLRSWFGKDAGLPGTGFNVRFSYQPDGWHVEPINQASAEPLNRAVSSAGDNLKRPILVDALPIEERFTRYVPVYEMEAAAGFWGPDNSPAEIGWTRIDRKDLAEGMFVAQIQGHSMEPRIPSGSWCLFRRCPAGSREGRILLIQFHSMSDPENGGRYTIKKYHSKKVVSENEWTHEIIELRPINPEYDSIPVVEQEVNNLLIIGEFIQVFELT